ncbi:MAG: DUF434 domain-containing protein [Nitrospinota bacterium]|nr:MAG: DUF434 domain-containing protein [Nitrospinota bacterium]
MVDPKTLQDPVCDFRFLLNRGYKRQTALNVVANKYQLDRECRHLLERTVFGEQEAARRRQKLVPALQCRHRRMALDGYNVLISIETALQGQPLLLSDDGVVRDLTAAFGRYRISAHTEQALALVEKTLLPLQVQAVLWVFDAQVSYSGHLAQLVRERGGALPLSVQAVTTPHVDKTLTAQADAILCSADRGVMNRAAAVFDLVYAVVQEWGKILSLPRCEEIYTLHQIR